MFTIIEEMNALGRSHLISYLKMKNHNIYCKNETPSHAVQVIVYNKL